MLRKAVFILTALLCLIVGGAVVYLLTSIPNDVQAEKLLSDARSDLQKKDRAAARTKLTTIVRDYPRTDAAAAASFALFRLADEENRELSRRLEQVEKNHTATSKQLKESTTKLEEIANRPATVIKVPTPAPKPAIRMAPSKRKTTPARKTPPRRRRASLDHQLDSSHLNSITSLS